MECPVCGFKGIRAEFVIPTPGKEWNHFGCPNCGKLGDKNTFTPIKKEA
jgi:predicted RNA-binding Zn-ribbon protein involved in translation (DUF1610 family)